MTVLDLSEADATDSSVTAVAADSLAVTTAPVAPLTWLKSTLMSILLRVVRGFGKYPWLVAPLVCCLPLALHLTGSDTPAEAYRVWLFHHFGFTIWNTQWYGGHTVLGYSVLFPPLAGFLGSGTVGLGACTLTAFWATQLIRRETGRQHRLALLAFSAAVVENLVVGRMAFAVGLAFAVLALLQVSMQRPKRALLSATLTSLASPLAGFFLLLAAVAWLRTKPLRSLLPLVGAMIGAIAVLMFPEQGTFPFPLSTLIAVLLVAVIGLAIVPRTSVVIRRALWIYALIAVPLFIVPNPIGGNLARPGSLLAVPVAMIALRHRRIWAGLVLVPLLVWHFEPIVPALASRGDPAAKSTYYTGLIDYLKGHDQPFGRLEIPFTRTHWEARYVAPAMPLARGWERQLDLRYNAILYSKDLDQATYHEWLVENGVRWVALPSEPLDPSSEGELKVIRTNPSYLKPVWHDANWELWSVSGSDGLTTGPATMKTLTADSFTLHFNQPGNALVRIHSNPYWAVAGDVPACINSTAEGWTSVTSSGTGDVTVVSRFSLGGGNVSKSADGGCLPPF
ncbi:MAG TPA: hypothetical protein VHX15_03175 [Frankiaceae bacterium]|nr:hypothetical protein [Frankiaceae bacterium]